MLVNFRTYLNSPRNSFLQFLFLMLHCHKSSRSMSINFRVHMFVQLLLLVLPFNKFKRSMSVNFRVSLNSLRNLFLQFLLFMLPLHKFARSMSINLRTPSIAFHNHIEKIFAPLERFHSLISGVIQGTVITNFDQRVFGLKTLFFSNASRLHLFNKESHILVTSTTGEDKSPFFFFIFSGEIHSYQFSRHLEGRYFFILLN